MPLFEFRCPNGHTQVELMAKAETTPECEKCGQITTRIFTPPNILIPAYMKEENANGRARYKAWRESPETKALIKKGLLDVAPKGED